MNLNIKGAHTCELEIPSRSCIPQLPPQTGKVKRWLRSVKKINIVSRTHYNTQLAFQSTAQIVAERRRHHQTSYWFVIHPYSTTSVILQLFMPVVWIVLYISEPVDIGFYHPWERRFSLFHKFIYYCDIFNVMFVFLQFVSGYVVSRTQEVVLSPRRIALNYFKTHFVFDFIACIIPSNALLEGTAYSIREPYNPMLTLLLGMRQLRATRLPTCLRYLRTATYFVGLSETDHHFFCLVFLGMCILHWSACTIHVAPRVRYHPNLPLNSWMVLANITSQSRAYAYIVCLHTATMYFFNTGVGIIKVQDTFDLMILSCITIIGMVYMLLMIAYFLEVVSRVSASESKYEELVFTLAVFAKKMKLPSALKNRLLCYYEHKFQKKYFKEAVIQAHMSEHLKFEVILHSCRHLITTMELFNGLSKPVLGKILASLKTEIYLPNDVVYDPSHSVKNMYFIGYGSLALYTTEGVELCHLQDGNHFGAITILLPEFSDTLSVITVETSELFILSGEDFYHIFNFHQDFALRVKESVKRSVETIDRQLQVMSRARTRHDIVHDLRRGKILERNEKRTNRKMFY